MAFGKKQPEMFEAFRQSKGGKPEGEKPSQQQDPSSKPTDLKPPAPVPGKVKPPVKLPGTPPKPVVPTLQEAKPLSSKPTEPPKAPGPKLFEAKPPVSQTPPPKPVTPAALTPAAPASPATVTAKPVPGVTRPTTPTPTPVARPATPVVAAASRKPAGAGASPTKDLGSLRDSKDLHVVELGKKSEVVFGLSYQALTWAIVIAFAAVVVIVLIALAIFGGKGAPGTTKPDTKVGAVEPGKTPAKTGEGVTDTGRPVTPTDGTFPPGTYYSVMVLTVGVDPTRLREVDGVMEFLKDKRVGEIVRKTNRRGDKISLFAGAFVREHKADAEVLAKRIQKMMYHNRYEFKDAQVVSVQ